MKIRFLLLAILIAGCTLPDRPPEDARDPVVEVEIDDAEDEPRSDDEPTSEPEPDLEPEPEPEPSAECPQGVAMGDYHGKALVPVKIDGQQYEFVYDTGAPTSVVDLSVGERIGGGPYVFEVAGERIEVASLYAHDLRALGDIKGILGSDVVGNFVVSMDYGRRQFWLSDEIDSHALAACEHLAGEPTSVEFLYNHYIFVKGGFESRAGWLLLDSGASLGLVTEPVFEELQAERERIAIPGFYTPAAIGTFWAKLTTLGSVTVGDLRVENIVSRTVPEALIRAPRFPDGGAFLGLAPSGFLRHHLVSVDFPARRIRFDRLADSSGRQPVEFFPFGYGLAEDVESPEVSYLIPGSSAERAGVEVGDVLLRVNGHDVAQLPPSSRSWATVGRYEGQTSEVVVRRAGEELTFELEAQNFLEFGP